MNTLKHWKKKREMKILVISNWISTGWFYLLRCHSFVIIIYQYIKYSSKRTDIIANKKKGGNNNKIKKNQQMICSLSLSLKWNLERERFPQIFFYLRCLLSDWPLHRQCQLRFRCQLSILRLSDLSHSSFSLVRYRDSVP